ncbi:hypothetical protein GALMADRAFT_277685 [Galerina marginata CBS 339.88]|uniref:Cyanovirin-N domain-containing protein n=1 Tax=Galerina marginata (strain CBS 339.88) TaxID=685588 RepID=A0A067T9Y5_GALM3|nr:hypothetical protein GALMADRAFT_277685 [Galerina marginata CBS 339.88]
MALAYNSKNLTINNGGRLSGQAKRDDGSWVNASIDLHPKLGNANGQFDLKGRDFSGSAQELKVQGATELVGKLRNSSRQPVDASIDLAQLIMVRDGQFVFLSEREREYVKDGGRKLHDSTTALIANSKNLRIIDNRWLSGDTKRRNNTWTSDKIDLNFKLGNANGEFDVNGKNFAESAKDHETKVVGGTRLRALLRNRGRDHEALLELAIIIKVEDGSFVFRSLADDDDDSSASDTPFATNSRNLRIEGGLLSGQAKTNNGSWNNASLDLNTMIGNRNGRFDFDGRNFSSTAQEIKLDGTRLRAELYTDKRGVEVDSLDLATILEIVDGRFAFNSDFERQRNDRKKLLESLTGLPGDSRNLWISPIGLLQGETKKKNGSWTTDSINLNSYLGNDRGRFVLNDRRFSNSASDFRLEGTRLKVKLSSGSSDPSEDSLELSLVLRVVDGKFEFITEHQRKRIISSVFCMTLESERGWRELHGLCLNKYGKLEESEVDLDYYYKNDGGSFVSDNYGRSGNLSSTSSDVRLEVTSANIYLHARLQGRRGEQDANVDLNVNIENDNGRFKFEKHDGLLDRDGALTKFVEDIPVVGYIAALAHYCAGNTEWAKRAAAVATRATIVTIGVTIGSLIGGPMGAAIGAGVATSIGIAAEAGIRKKIGDEGLQGEFEDATVGRYIFETLKAMIATGAARQFSKWIKKIPVEEFSKTSETLGKLIQKGTGKVGSKGIKKTVNQIGDALVDDVFPQEWFEAEQKVKKL